MNRHAAGVSNESEREVARFIGQLLAAADPDSDRRR